MASIPTPVTFRVQAVGGKFLADDIGGARVTLRDAATGAFLDSGITRGNSGSLIGPAPSSPPSVATAKQIAIASKNLIALADGSAFWWLVPDSGSSAYSYTFQLAEPKAIEVTVEGPIGGLQSATTVRETIWVSPGQPVPALPGLVIQLPGLLVNPLSPAIHSQVAPGVGVGFAAKVTMMCGCQVAAGLSYWPESDFVVQAQVQQIGGPQGTTVNMSLSKKVPSVFESDYFFLVPSTGSGTTFYQATITAWQKSTGNTGSAVVNFFCIY